MTHTYQYALLRCVPRVDREEFLNVGVVVHAPTSDFLGLRWSVDERRTTAFAPTIACDEVQQVLAFMSAVADGDAAGGSAARASVSQRFGFLSAPRSTIVQPGPVHSGLCADPAVELERLLEALVR